MNKITSTIIILLSATIAAAQSTLFYNGKIFTGNPTESEISFFVVENGVIVKTGKKTELPNADLYSIKVDLMGKTVIPGIIDSHIHFIDGGLGLLQTSFFSVQSREELIAKIKATRNQLIDGIYIGRDLGYEPLKGDDTPILLLNELLGETPAILFLKSGHAAIANQAAIKKLGFKKTTSFTDGEIQMKGSEFTGWLSEGAAREAMRLINISYSGATVQNAITKIQSRALSYGITTIGDNTFYPYFYKIYQEMQKSGRLKIRVRARSYGSIPQTESLMKGLGKKHLGFIGGGVNPWYVKYHAMKFFEDQSLSAPAHEGEHLIPGGKVFLNKEQLATIFEANPNSTFAFHVQGEAGLQNILEAVHNHPSKSRHVIDHAGYASVQQIQEAGRLGLGVTILASQWFDYPSLVSTYGSHTPIGFQLNQDDLLNTRAKYELAHGALTSDYPYGMDTLFLDYPQIDGLNPFPMIAVNSSATFPNGSVIEGVKKKKLSTMEAIQSFTTNGAFVLGEEKWLGKIASGYRADFVVLQKDIFQSSVQDIYDTKVFATYIDGGRVFQSGQEKVNESADKPIKVSPTDYAIAPVIGYDPTLGMILGGAYFQFPLQTPGRYFDLQLQTISSGKINAQVNYLYYDLFKNTNLIFNGSYSNFFQYYFGEGDKNEPNDYLKIYSTNYRIKPELSFKLKNHYQVSGFTDVRGRRETLVTDRSGLDQHKKLFSDENTLAIGLSFQQDTRDNLFSSKKGTLKQVSLQYIPSILNVNGLGDAAQLTLDFRHFHEIGKSNIVLATRISVGYSMGSTSYLFRYSMGGSYALRGYYSNRFRGEKYYVGQAEARFPIHKRFSGTVFFDAGDITDNNFSNLNYSFGAGIRFALRQNVKLRLDYGIAKDQTGVFFTFSEAF
jgi:predicted amidohydrolase YtcJ